MELNEDLRKEIARVTVKYLRSRMLLTQQIIKNKEDKIDFDVFMALYNRFEDTIEMKKENEESVLEINGTKIPMKDFLISGKDKLVKIKSDYIILTENQIDEIMEYVKESIEKYGIGENCFYSNETYFLRRVLRTLKENISDKEQDKKKRVGDFLSYFYLNESQGFNRGISGRIQCGGNKIFEIITHDFKTFCTFDKDIKTLICTISDEDILLADNIYFGKYIKSPDCEDIRGLFLLKEDKKLKFISYDNELYDEVDEKTGIGVQLYFKLNTFLSVSGLSYLKRDIYNKDSFYQLIDVYNNSLKITSQEKEQIEKIIETAVNWWADVIKHPKFDNGDKSIAGGIAMVLSEQINAGRPKQDEINIEKFKTILGNKIRTSLMSNYGEIILDVDYNPTGVLREIIAESKLEAQFPCKTIMWVFKNKIDVSYCFSECKTIYSAEQEKDIKEINLHTYVKRNGRKNRRPGKGHRRH